MVTLPLRLTLLVRSWRDGFAVVKVVPRGANPGWSGLAPAPLQPASTAASGSAAAQATAVRVHARRRTRHPPSDRHDLRPLCTSARPATVRHTWRTGTGRFSLRQPRWPVRLPYGGNRAARRGRPPMAKKIILIVV